MVAFPFSSSHVVFACQVTIFARLYFFRAVLGSQQTRDRGTEISHILPVPTLASPIANIPHKSGTFIITDEPTLIDTS